VNYEDLRCETRGHTSWIIIDRPEAMNAVRPRTYTELCHAFEAADTDRTTRFIVLTGAGRGFCAGDDFNEIFLSEDQHPAKRRDAVLARLLDSGIKVSTADQALTLDELFAALRASIWSELKSGDSIPGPRRDLQREHLRRIVTALTRPAPTTPSDAVALFRKEARLLSAQTRAAAGSGARDASTRAHLLEAAGTLDEALKAPMVRQGV